MSPEERVRRYDEAEAEALDRATGITDRTCHARCEPLRDWFTRETRGALTDEQAHAVLDMLLNRMASDVTALMAQAGDR